MSNVKVSTQSDLTTLSHELRHGLGVSFDARRLVDSRTARSGDVVLQLEGGARSLSWSAVRRQPELAKRLVKLAAPLSAGVPSWPRPQVVLVGRGQSGTVIVDRQLSAGRWAASLCVVAEAGSQVNVVERVFGAAADRFDSQTIVDVGRRAQLTFVTVRDLPEKAVDWSWRQAQVATGGSLRWLQAVFSAGFSLARIHTDLVGRDAQVADRTVLALGGLAGFDTVHETRHLARQSKSDVSCRAVMLGDARANCQAKLTVPSGMSGCQGRQKSATLMLGAAAEFAVQPELDVNVDDVSCSHAASVGRLDPEQLFYLMSRGLDRERAERQLAEGFLDPALRDLTAAGADEVIRCLIGRQFSS